MSNSVQPHGLQHARLPCRSPTLGACSNSCPSSRWCHPTISSPILPFSSCLQSFPASGSFSNESVLCIRWPKYWSFSISPSNAYSGLISFGIDWFGLLALQRTLKSILQAQLSLESNSQIHTWLLGKKIALTRWTLVSKVMYLLFNMLSRFVIAFLPRSKCLLILWLQSLHSDFGA